MYITNVTNDHDNVASSKYTDYDNMILTNCTNNENNIDIVIQLITIIPCGMSLICLISLMAYTLIKPLFKKNIIMNGEVSLPESSSWMYHNRSIGIWKISVSNNSNFKFA